MKNTLKRIGGVWFARRNNETRFFLTVREGYNYIKRG